MKRPFFAFTMMLLLFVTSAFVATENYQDSNNDPAVYKLMEVTFLWDLLKEEYQPIRDRDDTWLDVGFRSKYAMAKKYASLEMIETAFGCPVFLRGPHDKDMNFKSKTSFGYYNPEFVAKLRTSIELALKKPLFKKVTKQVYQQHLESMARTYHNAYTYLNKEAGLQGLQREYLFLMTKPEGIDTGSFQEKFRAYAESLAKNQQADVYEGFTAPAFWLRRSIDGTSKQLFELLDMVIKEMEKA